MGSERNGEKWGLIKGSVWDGKVPILTGMRVDLPKKGDFVLAMAAITLFKTSMIRPSFCRFASTVNSAVFQKFGNPVSVLKYFARYSTLIA